MAELTQEQTEALRDFAAGETAPTERSRQWLGVMARSRRELIRLWAPLPDVQGLLQRSLREVAPLIVPGDRSRPDRPTTDIVSAPEGTDDAVSRDALRVARRVRREPHEAGSTSDRDRRRRVPVDAGPGRSG